MQKRISKERIFILLSLAHATNRACGIAPLLLPLIREELHLTYMRGGLLLACHSIAFSVFTILSGHFGDIYEARKVFSFGFLLTVAAFSLLLLTQSYLQILVVLALVAVGMSVFYPVGMASVSRGWQKGIFFGLFQAAGCMGIFMATLYFLPWQSSQGGA